MKTSVTGLCSPLQQSYEVGSKRHSRKLKKQGKTTGQLKDAGFTQASSHRSTKGTTFMGSDKAKSSKKVQRKIKKHDKTAKQLEQFY